jgi:hypothetical protein
VLFTAPDSLLLTVELPVAQVYELAMLTCRAFDQERMASFLDRSNQLLARVNIDSSEEE